MFKEVKPESRYDVTIHGAKTLTQFTDGILKRGFKEVSQLKDSHHAQVGVIYQVHGAPQSEEDDAAILKQIINDIKSEDDVKRVILLHRPDEIEIRYPEFKDILKNATRPIGLTFLGDMHVDDDFFKAPNVVRRVIPHGFFENLSQNLQQDPIVIGSHTTWGEMRSVEHMIRLLGEVFRSESNKEILGYVGGKPKDQLQIESLQELWTKHNADVPIVFVEIHNKAEKEADRPNNTILVDSKNTMPDGLGLTYNVQLYYLNNHVRTGESSGSLHSSISIPVILEMNGSEAIEDLRVIKIPYGSRDDIGTVDFKAGTDDILRSVNDGTYVDMLKHNQEQSKKFTPAYVAAEYIKLFKQLG